MKKFWKNVAVKEIYPNQFQVHLDNKVLKTPMKKDLIFLNLIMAKEIAQEWDIEEKVINTNNMIYYGLLSTAIDKIEFSRNIYIKDMLNFVNTDLICYRAEGPDELINIQNNLWNPILSYIKKYLNLEINFCSGVMPITQPLQIFPKLKFLMNTFSNQEISALHRLTNISGSIFISLCILKGDVLKKEAFELSFLDEIWQAKNWGIEEDAAEKRDKISQELNKIISFVEILKHN
jgi:chaperone required for assembly of F1-ATPase